MLVSSRRPWRVRTDRLNIKEELLLRHDMCNLAFADVSAIESQSIGYPCAHSYSRRASQARPGVFKVPSFTTSCNPELNPKVYPQVTNRVHPHLLHTGHGNLSACLVKLRERSRLSKRAKAPRTHWRSHCRQVSGACNAPGYQIGGMFQLPCAFGPLAIYLKKNNAVASFKRRGNLFQNREVCEYFHPENTTVHSSLFVCSFRTALLYKPCQSCRLLSLLGKLFL